MSASEAQSRAPRPKSASRMLRALPALVLLWLSLELASTDQRVLAFNLDARSAIVHKGEPGSYFGYTVAQHRDRGVNWLLVGAPKDQTSQPRTDHSGAVYRCAANSAEACQKIAFDPTGSSTADFGGERLQADDKSRQWFGASLHSAADNGSIVACAPKYVYFSTNLRRRDPVGTCWVSRGSFLGFLEYSPCRLNDQWGHHHLGSCQAGFSSAITKDGGRIFMGAPGSHVWQGQVFAHNLRSDLTNATSSVNPHSEDDFYLGYSLALGKFSSASGAAAFASDTDVAIAIPRANQLAGKVMLVDREMRTLRNISGEQMGAYFGYALAVADVTGDGLDDLIVGAPLFYNQSTSHKEPHYDRGRIYVVAQNGRHEMSIVQRIDGLRNRARFGTALANCGDLNRDGHHDIAVGAPFDGPEQRGAVYIFMGRRSGLSEEPDQVIYAESIPREGLAMRSFGFSLSGGLDQDANSYPDLLVGDYEASRAVLLRARPVVNVNTSLTFQPENFNLDDRSCLLPNSSTSVSCIAVQYCTKYSGHNVDNPLAFLFDVRLDTENKGAPRLFFLHNEAKSEERSSALLTKDTNHCRSFKAYIARQVRDKLTPLRIDIEYSLAGEQAPEQQDARLRPILSRSAPNRMSKAAAVQKNCGYDNVCVPDLKLSMTPNVNQYTIGSSERLVLDVTVRNQAEDAFESMFHLIMPASINYININKSRADYPVCYKTDQSGLNVLACDLGNPQTRNDVVKFAVITEPARGDFTSPGTFTFMGSVNSTNPEQDERHREDNQVVVGVPIRVEANLVLSGSSNPQRIVHNSTQSQLNAALMQRRLREADLGPEVEHVYQLQNRGPSTINDVALTILWPTRTSEGKYLLYLLEEPDVSAKVKCKPAPADAINPENLLLQPRGISPSLATVSAGGGRYARQATDAPTASAQSSTLAPTTTIEDSVLQQLNLLTCGPTQCTRFECNVFDLGNNEIAVIKIRSRLYEETINSLSLQEFDISSKLVAQVKALPYNASTAARLPDVYKVETQVHTSGLAVQDLLPWWLIVLAILLGITLFVLLACFLRYLGFFSRKRPPKGAEREPLTPTIWNEYQYTPGDTAL